MELLMAGQWLTWFGRTLSLTPHPLGPSGRKRRGFWDLKVQWQVQTQQSDKFPCLSLVGVRQSHSVRSGWHLQCRSADKTLMFLIRQRIQSHDIRSSLLQIFFFQSLFVLHIQRVPNVKHSGLWRLIIHCEECLFVSFLLQLLMLLLYPDLWDAFSHLNWRTRIFFN